MLLKEVKGDICRLLETVKKLSARQEYSKLANMMLQEILPRFNADTLAEELKAQNKIKLFQDILETCDLYGLKHYARSDRNLKSSFYVSYVLS